MTELSASAIGAYCPALYPEARRRLTARVWMLTDTGLEKRCTSCRNFWPADTEFYYPAKKAPGNLHSWCKACYGEWRKARRADRHPQPANLEATA